MGAASTAYCSALSVGSKPIDEFPKVLPAWQRGLEGFRLRIPRRTWGAPHAGL